MSSYTRSCKAPNLLFFMAELASDYMARATLPTSMVQWLHAFATTRVGSTQCVPTLLC